MNDVKAINKNQIFIDANLSSEEISLFDSKILNSIQRKILENEESFFEDPSSSEAYRIESSFEELFDLIEDHEAKGQEVLDKRFNEVFCKQAINDLQSNIADYKEAVLDSKYQFDCNFLELLRRELDQIEIDFILGNRLQTIQEDLSIHHSVKAYFDSLIKEYEEKAVIQLQTKKQLENYLMQSYEDQEFVGKFLNLVSDEISIEDVILLQQVFTDCIDKIYKFYNLSLEDQFNRDFVMARRIKAMVLIYKINKEVKQKLSINSIFSYGQDSLMDYVVKKKQLSSIGAQRIYKIENEILGYLVQLIRNFS